MAFWCLFLHARNIAAIHVALPPQAISCHYASADCYYIDVKGTTQEKIENEVKEIAARKYSLDNINFQVGTKSAWSVKC